MLSFITSSVTRDWIRYSLFVERLNHQCRPHTYVQLTPMVEEQLQTLQREVAGKDKKHEEAMVHVRSHQAWQLAEQRSQIQSGQNKMLEDSHPTKMYGFCFWFLHSCACMVCLICEPSCLFSSCWFTKLVLVTNVLPLSVICFYASHFFSHGLSHAKDLRSTLTETFNEQKEAGFEST